MKINQLLWMALLNYDFDEVRVLYKQMKHQKGFKSKKIKFLIKSQQKKFNYLKLNNI